MRITRGGWTCFACLVLGAVCGQRSYTPMHYVRADDLPAVTPAIANTPPAKLPAVTTTEHLKQAAEHLDAAGQSALAQHVRQLAEGAAPPKTASTVPYGPVAPAHAVPFTPAPSPEWVTRPTFPPRGRVSNEVPPEMDDGALRFVQPARHKLNNEVRTTAAPPRGPI